MNTNKQLNKADTMKKIALVIGILSVLAVNAQAGTWTHTPTWGGGYTSTYTTTYNYLLGGWN